MEFCGQFDEPQGKTGPNTLCIREDFDAVDRKLGAKDHRNKDAKQVLGAKAVVAHA